MTFLDDLRQVVDTLAEHADLVDDAAAWNGFDATVHVKDLATIARLRDAFGVEVKQSMTKDSAHRSVSVRSGSVYVKFVHVELDAGKDPAASMLRFALAGAS